MPLKYGERLIPFETGYPPDLYQISDPPQTITADIFKQCLDSTLSRLNPDLTKPLIVVGDKTRLSGYPEYLPVLLECLQTFGAAGETLRILIAYGTHQHQSDEECRRCYGPSYDACHFEHHDCSRQEAFEDLGVTRRGTPVFLRRDIMDASFVITFGAISHHYFAGYGGGRKLIFPGLGYKPAIYHNHGLFLDKEAQTLATGCQPGRITGNPLAEDLAEIEAFKPADLAIHGILNSEGEVCDLLVGSGSDSFAEACRQHGKNCEIRSTKRYKTVLASCGGFPKDINFIQAHKAVHHAAAFVEEGGQLLVLAECRDGIGSQTFLPWFEMNNYQQAFKQLSRQYEGNGGTALAMMEKTRRIRISLMSDLDPAIANLIGCEAVSEPQAQKIVLDAKEAIGMIPNASLLVKTEPQVEA